MYANSRINIRKYPASELFVRFVDSNLFVDSYQIRRFVSVIIMPKLKTFKALKKKVKISKGKKVIRRSTGQNHFNSKETGKKGRAKKSDLRLFKADEKNALKALPYA